MPAAWMAMFVYLVMAGWCAASLIWNTRLSAMMAQALAPTGALMAVLFGLEALTGQRGTVGVGIPGAVVPATGLVKNANSVWLIGQPLGADLATRSVPMMVPAPPMFSMTIWLPRRSESLDATNRPIRSVPPPGMNGMMSRTGLVG